MENLIKRNNEMKIAGITLIVFTLILIYAGFVSAGLSDNLQNYYKMNETSGTIMIDIHGNSNGTIGNNVTLGEAGIINNSHKWLNFSGMNNISNASSMTTYSVSFWVKSNLNSTIGFTTDNFWNIFKTTNLQMTSNGQTQMSGYSPNNWNNIAIAIKPSNSSSFASHIVIYVNGINRYETEVGWSCHDTPSHSIRSFNYEMRIQGTNLYLWRDFISNSDCSLQSNGNHFFQLGDINNNYGTNFTDKYVRIDEFSVFKDYFFTPSDVIFLYNVGNPPTYEEITGNNPFRLLNFGNVFLSGTGFTAYNINGYYTNYNKFNISWFDDTLNATQIISKQIGEPRTTITGDIEVYLDGQINTGTITFNIAGLNKNITTNMTIRAINENGFDEQSFIITTSAIQPSVSEGVFSQIVSSFSGIFPDSSNLSTSTKWAYVIISIFLVTGTLLFVVGKEHIIIAVWLSIILDILLFFYFVVIGYIGAGTIITIALIGIGLTYFKLRQTG